MILAGRESRENTAGKDGMAQATHVAEGPGEIVRGLSGGSSQGDQEARPGCRQSRSGASSSRGIPLARHRPLPLVLTPFQTTSDSSALDFVTDRSQVRGMGRTFDWSLHLGSQSYMR